MATNPFAEFISGEALGAQPKLSYMAMLGEQSPRRELGPQQYYSPREEATQAQGQLFGSPFGTSPAAKRYFQSQFQNIYNEFLGNQGRALQGGQLPSQSFTQFLEQFPFTQKYSALPPEMSGRGISGFAPKVQFAYL
jgi:hypothetical protein